MSLTYTVKNTTGAPIVLPFASGQRYEMLVTPTGGTKPIWRASDGKMFNMMVGSLKFAPGESRTFTEMWHIPASAKPGVYGVTANLTIISRYHPGTARADCPAITTVTIGQPLAR